MSSDANRSILDEINRAGAWFCAKKTRPIWAKRAEGDHAVETREGVEQVRRGEYLCRGEGGEIWPQAADRVEAQYITSEEVDSDGWRKYAPNANAKGVLAAQVDHPFAVHTARGVLSGKAGDYIVKNAADRDTAYPDDVWIVDQALFRATYRPV
jgi:hypothetical protein